MNIQTAKEQGATPLLMKADPTAPAILVVGNSLSIRGGTTFNGRCFDADTPIEMRADLIAGTDYGIIVGAETVEIAKLLDPPTSEFCLGGFHFAAGGNAPARAGGDEVPAINPYSLWDINFRPSCPDPRGMVLVQGPRAPFWCDIYLLGVGHLAGGTSRLGATIADGNSPPDNPAGGQFDELDYATAAAVMAHHGKGLLGIEEFFAAAYGVTEKTAHDGDPSVTQLDAPRTSRFGLMQATGNMWQWGHDGDPDQPRASIFGGSWWSDGGAGSRCAAVAYYWPDNSVENLGARGRSDHLQLG
jgi:hypothetical protein